MIGGLGSDLGIVGYWPLDLDPIALAVYRFVKDLDLISRVRLDQTAHGSRYRFAWPTCISAPVLLGNQPAIHREVASVSWVFYAEIPAFSRK